MFDYDNVVEVDFEDDDDDELEGFIDELDDDDDDMSLMGDDGDDAIERKFFRRPSRSRSKKARGSGYYNRLVKGYATKKQLSTALARVGRDVKRNRTGISSNGRRISRLSSSTGKAIKTVRSEVDNIKQMSLFTSLLGGDQKLKVVNDPSGVIAKDTVIEFKDESDTIDKLLPVLMMGGLGGSSGKGGMMDNPLMMILLLGGLK